MTVFAIIILPSSLWNSPLCCSIPTNRWSNCLVHQIHPLNNCPSHLHMYWPSARWIDHDSIAQVSHLLDLVVASMVAVAASLMATSMVALVIPLHLSHVEIGFDSSICFERSLHVWRSPSMHSVESFQCRTMVWLPFAVDLWSYDVL